MLGKVIIILVTFLLRDTFGGIAVTFQISNILTISYIKNNPNFFNYCDKQLNDIVQGYALRKLAYGALKLSANDDPPTFFSDINGIGRLVIANPYDPDYHNKENLTKNTEQCDDAKHNPYNVFPQIHLYINGKMFSKQEQTDLGQFILYGGHQSDPSKLSKDGHGKITPSG
ncbi:682_t:CDS:2 [Cetraspora pellucida]|uniref:682_t:CDS:1 n=1 Tax=Cetraspora pellucida TaxID=1433469 RepID=A0A9N9FXF7_9GLOM|nr:682_t:CDS:2 [Cetraspora pellucida]